MLESTHRHSKGSEMSEDLIESYLDDELSEIERRRVERRAQEDQNFAAELELARRIRGGLRAMRLQCPPEVTSAALARISDEEDRQALRRQRWWSWLRLPMIEPGQFGAWRPGAATLGAALALVFLFTVGPASELMAPPAASVSTMAVSTIDVHSSEATAKTPVSAGSVSSGSVSSEPVPTGVSELSPDEVEAARREVELAFAYLGRLGRTAEVSVRRLATEKARNDHAY